MEGLTGPIEESVELTRTYPSVSERYFTKYYYIPKTKNREVSANDKDHTNGKDHTDNKNWENGSNNKDEQCMETEDEILTENDKDCLTNSERDAKEEWGSRSPLDNSGHTCVMIHTNKLCLVTLSHRHPILAQKKEVTQVSYEVGKYNRLENQVSGKGKRGAQMLGPQSPMCIISCSDGSRYAVMTGVHGKLVEVNERLLKNPSLVCEQPDAEGYLAVVLPPLRTIDNAMARLINKEDYNCLEEL